MVHVAARLEGTGAFPGLGAPASGAALGLFGLSSKSTVTADTPLGRKTTVSVFVPRREKLAGVGSLSQTGVERLDTLRHVVA